MPIVVDPQTGKKYNVAETQIAEAFQTGQWWDFEGQPKVALVSPEGRVIGEDFNPQKIQKALNAGFRFETPQEQAERYQKEKYGERGLEAGLAGAARGLTMGLSDVALTGTGAVEPAELAGLQQENVGASMAGEILGSAVPALVTGGAGVAKAGASAGRGVAKGAFRRAMGYTPAGAVARQAERARAAITGALGGGRAAKIAGSGIAYGAEGALYGAGTALSESAIYDKPLTAEAVMQHAGMGALLGGGLGATPDVLGGIITKTKGIAKKVRQGELGEVKPKLRDSVSGVIIGEDPKTIAKLTDRGPEGKRLREIIDKGKDLRDEYAHEISEDLSDVVDKFDKVSALSREEKYKGINKIIKRGTEDRVVASTQAVMNSLKEELDDIIEAGRGTLEYQGLVKKLDATFNSMDERVKEYIRSGRKNLNTDLFMELDIFKRDIGRLRAKMAAGSGARSTEYATADVFEDLYEQLRKYLETEELFGAAARAQKDINKTWAEYLGKIKATSKHELYRVQDMKDWQKVMEADTDGIRRLIDSAGRPRGIQDYNNFIAQLRLRRELAKKHAQHYVIDADTAKAVETVIDKTKKIEKRFEKARRDVALQETYARMKGRGVTGAIGGGLGVGGAGAALGHALGLGWTGAMLAGPVAGLAVGGLLHPASRVWTHAMLDRITTALGQKINKSVAAYLKKGRSAAVAGAAAGGTEIDNDEKVAQYKKVRKDIRQLAANPELLRSRLENRLKGLSETDPELAAHMSIGLARAVQHLNETLPQVQADMADIIRNKDADIAPSPEVEKWLRRLSVVEKPTIVLDRIMAGTITKEEIETLKEVYPRLHQQIVDAVIKKLSKSKEDIPYEKKLQLSYLLGQPLDRTLDPVFVRKMQESYLTQRPDQPAQPEPRQRVRVTGWDDLTLASRTQTRTSSIESKKAV